MHPGPTTPEAPGQQRRPRRRKSGRGPNLSTEKLTDIGDSNQHSPEGTNTSPSTQITTDTRPRQRRSSGPSDRKKASDSRKTYNHTARETSAGGLVVKGLGGNLDNLEAVLIGRLDRRGRMLWSLPKGHIETGETSEATAIREVAEETGISGSVLSKLGDIDYWFITDGRRIHKTVHHFLMAYNSGNLSTQDVEVAEVAWVPLNELPNRLTYSDERKLISIAQRLLTELETDPESLARQIEKANRSEPNAYEKAAARRNEKRTEPIPRKTRSKRSSSATKNGQTAAELKKERNRERNRRRRIRAKAAAKRAKEAARLAKESAQSGTSKPSPSSQHNTASQTGES